VTAIEPFDRGRPFERILRQAVEALLSEQLQRAGREFFFVQIGANDGVSFDWISSFIREHRLRGVAVEPLPDVFAELCRNYRDYPDVTLVNVAIHRSLREVTLYRVHPDKTAGLPDWAKTIASLDPQHHLKSAMPSEVIVAETVPAIPLEELLDGHGITRIDLLQIDVEGYDYEIIRMIDFDRIRPALIRFEHNVRSNVMSRQQLRDCVSYLMDAGYYILMDTMDAVAYLRG
jgi:FkbM family methyltransferase